MALGRWWRDIVGIGVVVANPCVEFHVEREHLGEGCHDCMVALELCCIGYFFSALFRVFANVSSESKLC